jgi:hypothetical protein
MPDVFGRFWSKVDGGDVTTCWIWRASRNPAGYGYFYVHAERSVGAHRFAYETMRGDTGKLQLDHLCNNRACVNPWHLEPVTESVNMQRSQHHRLKYGLDPNGEQYYPRSGRPLLLDASPRSWTTGG